MSIYFSCADTEIMSSMRHFCLFFFRRHRNNVEHASFLFCFFSAGTLVGPTSPVTHPPTSLTYVSPTSRFDVNEQETNTLGKAARGPPPPPWPSIKSPRQAQRCWKVLVLGLITGAHSSCRNLRVLIGKKETLDDLILEAVPNVMKCEDSSVDIPVQRYVQSCTSYHTSIIQQHVHDYDTYILLIMLLLYRPSNKNKKPGSGPG